MPPFSPRLITVNAALSALVLLGGILSLLDMRSRAYPGNIEAPGLLPVCACALACCAMFYRAGCMRKSDGHESKELGIVLYALIFEPWYWLLLGNLSEMRGVVP